MWRGVILGAGGRGRRIQEETGEAAGSGLSREVTEVTGTGAVSETKAHPQQCFLAARPQFPHLQFPTFHKLSKQPEVPGRFTFFCG